MGVFNYLLKKSLINAAENVTIATINAVEKANSTSPEIIRIPRSSSEYIGKNYLDIQNELLAYGFTNIACLPIKDLIKGWLTKDGSIKRISINGKSEFKSKAKIQANARITIEYHTFKNK